MAKGPAASAAPSRHGLGRGSPPYPRRYSRCHRRKRMTQALTNDLDAFRGLHVAVIGEAMLDSYLDGGSSRLCPEAPVPVVAVAARRDAAGGAANTAVNLRALGATVAFLSVVGDDPEAFLLGRR